jgi:hypothetical protein
VSFADLPLASVDVTSIEGLLAIAAPEGLRLEFKRELDLTSREQKREAGKDASAMANTLGGRILYGVDEIELPDGSKVAGRIIALSEEAAADKLADVLAAVITPRPSFNTHVVSVPGGSVLVLEVYASPVDLHMVSGYDDFRYYRRGPKGTIKMTEPEIREAYARISAIKRALDQDIDAAITSEAPQRDAMTESIFIVPWHASRNLADPRVVGHVGQDLANGVFSGTDLAPFLARLRLGPDGYRSDRDGYLYLAVLRNGVVHVGFDAFTRPTNEWYNFPSRPGLARIVEALLISRYVLGRASYWGPVRVLYRLRPGGPFTIDGAVQSGMEMIETPLFSAVPVDVNFQELGDHLGKVAKEILDQIFQLEGVPECPYFDRDGRYTEGAKKHINVPPRLLRFLE